MGNIYINHPMENEESVVEFLEGLRIWRENASAVSFRLRDNWNDVQASHEVDQETFVAELRQHLSTPPTAEAWLEVARPERGSPEVHCDLDRYQAPSVREQTDQAKESLEIMATLPF